MKSEKNMYICTMKNEMIMNIEKLFETILNTPNIDIQYSNINGVEKLIVNGEEIKGESKIIKDIKEYKENIELLDDCLFVKAMEKVAEDYCINEIETFLNKEEFTKEEEKDAKELLNVLKNNIRETILDEIQDLYNLIEKF